MVLGHSFHAGPGLNGARATRSSRVRYWNALAMQIARPRTRLGPETSPTGWVSGTKPSTLAHGDLRK